MKIGGLSDRISIMLTLKAEKREASEGASTLLRQEWLPGVVYGFEMETRPLKINRKEFQKIYQEAGESTLVSLALDGGEKQEAYTVLIQEVQRDPVTDEIIHADFYHPSAKKKVEAWIPIVFEGEAPAVNNFGGTVLKEMKEVEVKGLAIHLPHEIKVDLGSLENPHDRILVKDLSVSPDIEVLADPESIVAMAVPAEAVEAELEKSVDEMVEPVEAEAETESAAEEEPSEEN